MRRVKETRPITDLTGPRIFIDLTHLDDEPKPKPKTKPKPKPKPKPKSSSSKTKVVTATATNAANINKTVAMVVQRFTPSTLRGHGGFTFPNNKFVMMYDTSAKISEINMRVAISWGLMYSPKLPMARHHTYSKQAMPYKPHDLYVDNTWNTDRILKNVNLEVKVPGIPQTYTLKNCKLKVVQNKTMKFGMPEIQKLRRQGVIIRRRTR